MDARNTNAEAEVRKDKVGITAEPALIQSFAWRVADSSPQCNESN